MTRFRVFFTAFFMMLACGVFAQTIDLCVIPRFNLPFGPSGSDGQALYSLGGGCNVGLDFGLAAGSPFFLRAQVGYDLLGIPAPNAPTSLNVVSLGAGSGLAFYPGADFSLKFALTGGGGMFFVPDFLGDADPNNDFYFYPYARAEAAVGFKTGSLLTFSVGANYTYYLTNPSAYNGLGATIGLTFHFAWESGRVKIREFRLDPVFPVFYSSYDDISLGTLVIVNEESGSIRDVCVSFLVKEYMDAPAQLPVIREMQAGEEKSLPLYAIFSDKLMRITEGTKLTAEAKVEYVYDRKKTVAQGTGALTVYDRNAMTWDDDRKAAVFVTAKSPTVLSLSKSAGVLARGNGLGAINLNFRTGVAVFEALGLFGMKYVVDPSSSYKDKAAQKTAVDYLQFPVQSLEYRSGDCDDLSILYAALLESVAVKTAFITVPGHIYLAYSLGLTQVQAGKLFTNTRDLIFTSDDTWVPVEVTMMDRGFLPAWRRGAEEWREASGKQQTGFFEVGKAWEKYKPVGIEEQRETRVLDENELEKRYAQALQNLVQREIGEQATELEKQIASRQNNPALLNKLGLLYARYGLEAEAEEAFGKAIKGGGGWMPLCNLANLHFMRGDYKNAAYNYRKSLEQNPGSVSACVGLLLVAAELGQDKTAVEMHEKLKKLDARTAERYAPFISTKEGGRAAALNAEEVIVWDE